MSMTGTFRHFGPVTLGGSAWHNAFGVILSSGDDDRPGCHIRLSAFRYSLICDLPPIVAPHRAWIPTAQYGFGPPGSGYEETSAREYGFLISDGRLSLRFGKKELR